MLVTPKADVNIRYSPIRNEDAHAFPGRGVRLAGDGLSRHLPRGLTHARPTHDEPAVVRVPEAGPHGPTQHDEPGKVMADAIRAYLDRMKPTGHCPPRKPMTKILWSWLGALLGIYAIGACSPLIAAISGLNGNYVVGSFGAVAVLLYGSPMAEFAQPRNLLLGNVISALVGVAVAIHVPDRNEMAFAGALAVSSSVLLMHLTRSMHPPGGATALIAVIGGDEVRALGYWYVVYPVLCGTVILLCVALVVNNLSSNPKRHYPVYWF